MAYWLLKSEPDEYSWENLVKRVAKGEAWTGVRNFAARKNLKDMKKGDGFFFYHTGDEKQVVGIGKIVGEAFPDPTAGKNEPRSAVTAAAETRHASRDQERTKAQVDGACKIRAAFCSACHSGRVEARM